ncbi:hypothetical protein [Wenxinia marina]|uniref:Lipoprotein n=1 Tax=Wenxinia marina DSM 24838 TaxID=1123501 RepID=A0A0D0NI55_9RHOB|nr:hypothetical protein [Wenxinia marina]KIQ68010.1 hypothetical protein Wenmar_03466 [Wenxinia marina DSM 24838]GGL75424.1 hypothetical protein GCM10011392_32600 [Wenxinia marina]
MFRTAALIALIAGPAAAQTLTLVETDEYGPVVADESGRYVYAFHTEVRAGDGLPALESCGDPKCLEDWPRVEAPADLTVGEGLDETLVSSITWDGMEVLQYSSQPLFYFAGDEPGESPQGQENHSYGGWWYLLDPLGFPIVTGIAPDPGDPDDIQPQSGQAELSPETDEQLPPADAPDAPPSSN